MKASMTLTCSFFLMLGLTLCHGSREFEGVAGQFESARAASFQDENQPAKESDFVFPILVEGKWGLIDQSGKIVVRPGFDSIGPMRASRNLVRAGFVVLHS